MEKEKIEKLEIYKSASPPSAYNDKEAEAWSEGLNFGIDKIIEKLSEIPAPKPTLNI